MSKLNIAPTKSNLLSLKRQLAFAEEGYDLLEQKRQILILELVSRLKRLREVQSTVALTLKEAFAHLRGAQFDIGSDQLDRAILAVNLNHLLSVLEQHLMGIKLAAVNIQPAPIKPQFGIPGTCANADLAMQGFVKVLQPLGELAQLQTAIARLKHELRKTQRRCNALSKLFIPAYRETIAYITGCLEERERESLIILKMIRNRLSTHNSRRDASR